MDLLLDDHHLDTDAVSLKKNIQNQIKLNFEASNPNGHSNHMSVKGNLILSYLHFYNSTFLHCTFWPLLKRVMSQDRYCVGADENRGHWMNIC